MPITRAIKAIFFTRFHHEKGTRVLHQVPEGSIVPSTSPFPPSSPSASALPQPLFDFDSITSYLIPTQQFCDRLLTFCVNHYRVIGYPVCIREGKYSRNEYIFNFAVVVEEGLTDWKGYGECVRKLGRLLRGLEEQGGFLSGEEDRMAEGIGLGLGAGGGNGIGGGEDGGVDGFGVGGGSKVYALCEMVLEDLNNYAECMIPIDESNTINLKLFPTRPPPPPIHAHQVPLLTISLSSFSTPISSDLTLNRILPYINGVNSVSHIAQLADTDLSLTRKAIQHLIYYGCLVLLDIFSFGAVYAPTAEIGGFVVDESVKEECARYVAVPRIKRPSSSRPRAIKISSESEKSREERSSIDSSSSQQSERKASNATEIDTSRRTEDEEHNIDHETLITLFTSLRQGLTLKNWVLENLDLLGGIDVRRFITFGIIKGFIYRVHKYAISASSSLPPAPPASLRSVSTSTAPSTNHNHRDSDQVAIRGHHNSISQHHHLHPHHPSNPHIQSNHLHHKPSMASTTHAVGAGGGGTEDITRLDSLISDEERNGGGLPLVRFLDGMHCFDEICTELGLSEKVVEGKIRGAGEVAILHR